MLVKKKWKELEAPNTSSYNFRKTTNDKRTPDKVHKKKYIRMFIEYCFCTESISYKFFHSLSLSLYLFTAFHRLTMLKPAIQMIHKWRLR